MRSTTAAVAALCLAAAAGPALAETTVVQIDQAARVTVGGSAATVFSGNGSIADVAIINRNTVMVIGKGYGLTNIVALDSAGRTIMNRQVQVGSNSDGRMTLYRGVLANNFACAPMCERTAMPGEDQKVYENSAAPYKDYTGRQAAAPAVK